MNKESPLFVISLEQGHAESLADLSNAVGFSDAFIVEGSIKDAIEPLTTRETPPSYMIIDIASHGMEILDDIDVLAEHCEPDLRVVVIGSINDINFYREIKQRGIMEYFNRPAQAADINAVFQAAEEDSLSNANNGSVITCMSAASGDGSSTLAMNLAFSLATTYKQPTVLVDMDYQFGLIASSLDVTASFGIHDLFDHPEHSLDTQLVDKMLVKYGRHLHMIASGGDLRMLPQISAEHVSELIGVLRSRFTFVVIDVPHVWTPWTAAALIYADHRLMVAQLWLRSLTHASRLLKAWQEIGVEKDKISVVINRSGAKFKEGISAEDFERICHHQIDAHINNDIKVVAQAETQGKTLFEMDQGEILQQQIEAIAKTLALSYQPGISAKSAISDPSTKKGLKGLFEKKGN